MENSWVFEELHRVRNTHAAFEKGVLPGLVHAGFTGLFTKGKEPWTLRHKCVRINMPELGQDLPLRVHVSCLPPCIHTSHGPVAVASNCSHRDADRTEPLAKHEPIIYPKPDGKLSFDLLTNLQLSGTNHEVGKLVLLRPRRCCRRCFVSLLGQRTLVFDDA